MVEEKNQEGERQDFGGCSSEADVINVHFVADANFDFLDSQFKNAPRDK